MADSFVAYSLTKIYCKMNIVKTLLIVAFSAATASTGFAQEHFTNCAAAFLDNKMVVSEYSPAGICEIPKSATGVLTVQTADLSPHASLPTGKLAFKIALRDRNTKTLLSFSDKTYKQVDIQSILAKCQPGDAIVLLTTTNEFALPHQEILVK